MFIEGYGEKRGIVATHVGRCDDDDDDDEKEVAADRDRWQCCDERPSLYHLQRHIPTACSNSMTGTGCHSSCDVINLPATTAVYLTIMLYHKPLSATHCRLIPLI